MDTLIKYEETNREYHSKKEFISSSFVKGWNTATPYHVMHGKKELSPSIADLGSAVHAMWEGKNRKQVVIGKHKTRAGKAWAEDYAKAQENDQILLPEGEYQKALRMTAALWKNEEIRKLGRSKQRVCEASIYCKHERTGLLLKARPDQFNMDRGVVLDIKTTISADPSRFQRQFFDLGYGIQAAFYRMVCEQQGIECKYFAFGCVEKTEPFATNLFIVSQDLMDRYTKVVERTLDQIKLAQETNDYSTGWPNFTMIHTPEWMKQDDEWS